MPKVLVTGAPLSEDHVRRLVSMGYSVTNGTEAAKLVLDQDPNSGDLTEDETSTLIADTEIYIYGGFEALSDSVLSASRDLKLITFLGTGWDDPGCVDANAASRIGITVTNTPHANGDSVAELAVGLAVTLSRDSFWLNKVAKSGEWIQRVTSDVSGRTLGIVGLGYIGSAVARHARRGFDMKITYAGPHRKSDAEAELDATHLPLDELLRTADIVSIHSPATATQGLIVEELLGEMRAESILINLSQPGIVDGEALYRALSVGAIRAAAMDGKYDQPLHDKYRTLDDDRFVFVPRTAWLTTDSYRRMGDMALESIEDFNAQRTPVHNQRLPLPGEVSGQ